MTIDNFGDNFADNLGNDEVHIWQASTASQHTQLFQYLTDEERLRADRYVHVADGVRFIVARGLVRLLLGRYLGIDPVAVLFEYGAHGKPTLAQHLQSSSSVLHFNLSHAGDRVAYIFTKNRPSGVDIERIRDNLDHDAIAERFFSESEFSALQALKPADRLVAFFNVWARKEAFIKAIGTGLFYSLQQFDVSVDPNKPAALLAIQGDAQKAQQWYLQAFTPAEGYVGAFATEGKVKKVEYYLAEGE